MTEQPNHNGRGDAIPLPSATELMLSNGFKVWVYPMSAMDFVKIKDDFDKLNPLPDKKDYEVPVPEMDASFPGQTLGAENNPEYKKVLLMRGAALKSYIIRSYLLGYVEFQGATEDELVQRYARVVKQKRRAMTLPEDAWEATVLHALITEIEDQQLIVNVIERKMPLSEGEITEQVRIFRPVHRGQSNGKLSERDIEPSSAEA